jgi:hypothetical protein
MQAEAGPAGCESRGFGWSATVEVCSARVTRLVTDQEKSKKLSATQLVPGTGLGGFVPGAGLCLAPGWAVPGAGLCLAPGWAAGLLASRCVLGRCLALDWQ